MSKPLGKFPLAERTNVANRRVASGTLGLGYWSAVAYLERLGMPKKPKTSKKKVVEE